jgi:hypothetical protein
MIEKAKESGFNDIMDEYVKQFVKGSFSSKRDSSFVSWKYLGGK